MQDPTTPPAGGTPARSRTGPCALGPRRASATPRERRKSWRPPTSLLPIHSPAGGFRRPGRSAVPMPSHADPGGRTYTRPRRRPLRRGAGAARPSSLPRCRCTRTASPRPSLASRAVTPRTRRAGAYGYPLEPSSPGLDGAPKRAVAATDRTPKSLVGLAGVEPTRSCARGRRATKLPNRPTSKSKGCGREDLHLHGPEPDGFSDRRVCWFRHARAKSGTVGRTRTSMGRSPPRSERGASAGSATTVRKIGQAGEVPRPSREGRALNLRPEKFRVPAERVALPFPRCERGVLLLNQAGLVPP